jgi:hypothetical protein
MGIGATPSALPKIGDSQPLGSWAVLTIIEISDDPDDRRPVLVTLDPADGISTEVSMSLAEWFDPAVRWEPS